MLHVRQKTDRRGSHNRTSAELLIIRCTWYVNTKNCSFVLLGNPPRSLAGQDGTGSSHSSLGKGSVVKMHTLTPRHVTYKYSVLSSHNLSIIDELNRRQWERGGEREGEKSKNKQTQE